MVGVTYRASLLGRLVVVFERDDGTPHPLLATTRRDGTFDIWQMTGTAEVGRIVAYEQVQTAVRNRGIAYLV